MKKIENNEQYFEDSFDNLTLPSLDIINAEFEECEFNDCDFASSIFSQCKFIGCSFNRCNLSLVKLPASRLFELDFVDSNINLQKKVILNFQMT